MDKTKVSGTFDRSSILRGATSAHNFIALFEAVKKTASKDNFRFPDTRFAILCAFAAFVLYANTITHSYVLDDAGVITNNAFVQQGVAGIGKLFTSEVWHFEGAKLGYYRPLSLVTFAMEKELFNNNPHVSHFINVVLYAATAFFVCLLLLRVFRKQHPAFSVVAALLFVAHPVHTEVVANIKSRDEILSLLNLVISIYFLLIAYRSPRVSYKWLSVSLVFFYLALLSKESAIVGVALIPLVFFFEGNFSFKQILTRTVPFAIAVALFLVQKYFAIGSMGSMQGEDIVNYPYAAAGNPIANTLMIFAWCMKLILFPHPLLYSYAYNQIPAADWPSMYAIGGLMLAALLAFSIYRNLKEKTPLAFGLLWLVISLAPALGFVYLRGGIFAERFLYSATLGFSMAVAWLLFRISKFNWRSAGTSFQSLFQNKMLAAVLLPVLALYSFQTINRNGDWKDELTLVSHDAQYAENNCQVQLHYGMKLMTMAIDEKKRQQRARLFTDGAYRLKQALRINPHLAEAYYHIGQGFQKVAMNPDSAVWYYNRAAMENTAYPFTYLGLATLYEEQGKKAMASYYYNKAVEMNPGFADAVRLRSRHRAATGLDVKQFPSEKISTADSLSDDKKDFAYYHDTGKQYGQRGDFANAIIYLEKSVVLNPRSEEALIDLSVCYGMTRQNEKSIRTLERVLLLNPRNKDALNNLSIMYEHIGNKAKGEEYKRRVEQL